MRVVWYQTSGWRWVFIVVGGTNLQCVWVPRSLQFQNQPDPGSFGSKWTLDGGTSGINGRLLYLYDENPVPFQTDLPAPSFRSLGPGDTTRARAKNLREALLNQAQSTIMGVVVMQWKQLAASIYMRLPPLRWYASFIDSCPARQSTGTLSMLCNDLESRLAYRPPCGFYRPRSSNPEKEGKATVFIGSGVYSHTA